MDLAPCVAKNLTVYTWDFAYGERRTRFGDTDIFKDSSDAQ